MTTAWPWIAALTVAFVPFAADAEDTVPPPTWTLSSLYSYSALSDDRGDWNEGSVELLGRASPDLTLGAHVDVRDRSNGTDQLYGVLGSYRVMHGLEAHANARYAPSPDFSAKQTYGAGVEWRAL